MGPLEFVLGGAAIAGVAIFVMRIADHSDARERWLAVAFIAAIGMVAGYWIAAN